MKTKQILLAIFLLAIVPFVGFAQEWDDIRANPRAERNSQLVQPTAPQPQRQIVVATGYTNTMEVIASTGVRDIDEFNRRNRTAQDVYAEDMGGTYQEFQYTERIVRFHNPESVIQISGADEVIIFTNDALFDQFNNRSTSVNIHVGMGWGSPWGWNAWHSPWFYDPWFHPWHRPWGWHAWHRPWGWGSPWGWSSWHAWHSPWGWYGGWGWYSSWHGGIWGGPWVVGGWSHPVIAQNPSGRSTNARNTTAMRTSSVTQNRMSTANTSRTSVASMERSAATRTSTASTTRNVADLQGTTTNTRVSSAAAPNTRVSTTTPNTRIATDNRNTTVTTRQSNVTNTPQTRQSTAVTPGSTTTHQRVTNVNQQPTITRNATTTNQTVNRTTQTQTVTPQRTTTTTNNSSFGTSNVSRTPVSSGSVGSGASSAGARTSGAATGARR